MHEIELHLTVNGNDYKILTEPHRTLLEVLREDLGLTSVKDGCGKGDCGACMVVMNRLAVNSCLVLAPQAEGADVVTLEGLARDGDLHPLQQHFANMWAFQCGYCTPGMIMSCYAMLLNNPHPTADDVREAICGNLCRCTDYSRAVKAVQKASLEGMSRAVSRVNK